MPTTVTKPPILDETGQDILTQLRRIADAKESNLMGYGGAVMFASLPTPTTSNLNLFYLVKDAFTTDNNFVVGPGVSEPAGKYWAVINIGTTASPVCKYDELGTLIDLSAKQDKTLSSPLSVDGVTQTTVEGALSGINTLAANNKTSIGTLSNLATTSKTDLVVAVNEVKNSVDGKLAVAQGVANVGKVPMVDASGDLVLSTISQAGTKMASSSYVSGASSVNVSIDLDDGDYAVEAFCGEERVTKQNVTYASKVVTVTFDDKPSSAGTLWVIARKVA